MVDDPSVAVQESVSLLIRKVFTTGQSLSVAPATAICAVTELRYQPLSPDVPELTVYEIAGTRRERRGDEEQCECQRACGCCSHNAASRPQTNVSATPDAAAPAAASSAIAASNADDSSRNVLATSPSPTGTSTKRGITSTTRGDGGDTWRLTERGVGFAGAVDTCAVTGAVGVATIRRVR